MSALISVVVPAFNESQIIRHSLEVILNALRDEPSIELIVVDDGSSDGTDIEIARLAASDLRIRPLYFSRNFGKEAAIYAGLLEAKGDCAIVIDADLQHPPHLMPEMLRYWRLGFPIVECVKISRGDEPWLSKLFAYGFYSIFKYFSGMDLRNYSDYKLLDRVVIDYYKSLPEHRRFFRGLIYWTGYPTARIPFEVSLRERGTSRWSKLKLLRYAIDNLTSFSALPLHFVTIIGFMTLLFGLTIGINSIYQKLSGIALDGFTTVNLLIIMMGSAIMIALGIIGHYLSRIYEEIKGRPIYLLKQPPKVDS